MLARITVCLLLSVAAGCVTQSQPCSAIPSDPLCQIDAGPTDTGLRADGGDAAAPRDGAPDTGNTPDMGSVDAFRGDTLGPCAGSCMGTTPLCLEATSTCVACLGDGDCGGDRCDPSTHECVQCLGDGGDACPVCNVAANECVECLTNDQCTSATASACNTTTHACEACDAPSECAHLTGLGICEVGECVQCTAAIETACGANSCDPATNACTSTPRASIRRCGACVADSECLSIDDRCVPMEFMGAPRAGGYCLKLFSTTCARPYTVPTPARASLSGAPAVTYCGLDESVTTCDAILDLVGDVACAAPTSCGDAALSDGRCETVGGVPGRCTYDCGTAGDCPAGRNCTSGYCGS